MITFKNGQTSTSAVIAADVERVWNIIIDTHLWPKWGPSVSTVECVDRFITAQSSGRLQTALGLWVPFTITDFEDGHFWSWRIGRIEATGHRVSRHRENQSVVSFTMPWWSTPYLIICMKALDHISKIADVSAQTETRYR